MKNWLFPLLAILLAWAAPAPAAEVDEERLAAVLEAQDGDIRMRYLFRNP